MPASSRERLKRAHTSQDGDQNPCHALRNALIPLVTMTAIQFGYLIGITITIEFIFAIPGMGSALLDAVLHRDVPVIQGFTLFMALVFIVTNLVADLVPPLTRPRSVLHSGQEDRHQDLSGGGRTPHALVPVRA
jgi:ABC-type dipeptide/oligopeptide/nickel transport system permease component